MVNVVGGCGRDGFHDYSYIRDHDHLPGKLHVQQSQFVEIYPQFFPTFAPRGVLRIFPQINVPARKRPQPTLWITARRVSKT